MIHDDHIGGIATHDDGGYESEKYYAPVTNKEINEDDDNDNEKMILNFIKNNKLDKDKIIEVLQKLNK